MDKNQPRWWRKFIRQLTGWRASEEEADIGSARGQIRVRAAGGTDVGRQRENNEDSFLCLPEEGLFIVADGMGGEAAGEEASRIAVEVVQEHLSKEAVDEALRSGPGLELLFREALEEANQAILREARSHPGWQRMGTTVVAAVAREGVVYLCNLGDSRAYLVHKGKASALTRDHSTVMALVEAGHLRPEEARKHPLRNELTACLGMNKPLQPGYYALRLRPGDRIILCSDGLWDMVSDETIARIASIHSEPEMAVEELIGEANQAGGHDNITVIVIVAESGEPHEKEEISHEAQQVEVITQEFTLREAEEEVKESARSR